MNRTISSALFFSFFFLCSSVQAGQYSFLQPVYTLLLGGSKQAAALPEPSGNTPQYTLAVHKQGNGWGSVISQNKEINCGTSCSARYVAGEVVTLAAVVETGSSFNGWYAGGNPINGCPGKTCTVIMDEQKQLTAAFAMKIRAEIEPNNDRNAATSTVLDNIISGNLSDAADQDWFEINNSSGSARTATVRFNNVFFDPTRFWIVQVYNSYDMLLAQVAVGNADTFNVTLPAGDRYYFVVLANPDFSGSSMDYTMTLLSNTRTPVHAAEREENNGLDLADFLSFDAPVDGQLMTADDEDWFRLSNDTAGRTATVAFATSAPGRDWLVSVYRADGTTLLARVFVGDGSEFNIALPDTGTTYLVVHSDHRYDSSQYTLTVLANDGWAMPVAEQEPNNSKAGATAVNFTTGTADMTGQLEGPFIEDWFKFDSPNSRDITVTFSTNSAVGNMTTHWLIYLYNKNDIQLYYGGASSLNDKIFQVNLPSAGSYYFRIKSYLGKANYDSSQYRIIVETDTP
jgi:hypothetical protein